MAPSSPHRRAAAPPPRPCSPNLWPFDASLKGVLRELGTLMEGPRVRGIVGMGLIWFNNSTLNRK